MINILKQCRITYIGRGTPRKFYRFITLKRTFLASNKIKMSKPQTLLKPKACVRGITELDKTLFENDIQVPCINITQTKLSDVLPHLKKYMLKLPKLKPVQSIEDKTFVLMNPDIVCKWYDIDENNRKSLSDLSITEDNFVLRDYKLTYDNYTAEDILKAVLPLDQEGMSSYTKVGHIVHVNLREHLHMFKHVIGSVLFDKIPFCETVVNKVNIIDNTYRNFQMEVLHGKSDLKTKVIQNGCQFEFDFGTVYWNTRLSTEHERIIKFVNKGDILFDVFAGVGPFSIPATKRNCLVYANDLNPESYKWLQHNAKLNKVNQNLLSVFNKDAKDFILEDIKPNLLKHINNYNIHIVMNLPALALEFLQYFIELYNKNEIEEITNSPIVYVYCFAKGEDFMKITEDMISHALNRNMKGKIEMFRVRTVSSFKEMMRVKFKLTEDILIAKSSKRQNEEVNTPVKKLCYGEEQAPEGKEHIQSSGS